MSSQPNPEAVYPFLLVDVAPDEVDAASALLFELGAEGVEERDMSTLAKSPGANIVTLVGSFSTREAADEAMGSLDDEFNPRIEEIIGDAWRDEWKKHFRPFEVARGLVVRPPWEPYDAKPGEHVLLLEPGRAFGTGLHETTKLVAQALEREKERMHNAHILDVGTGSGILGLVALALGAQTVLATDIDDDALAVARENAEANGLTARFRTANTPPGEIDEQFPIVLANIEARVLIPMAPELAARVAPGGVLLLSGILVGQEDDVRAAYAQLGARDIVTMGEWVLVTLDAPRANP